MLVPFWMVFAKKKARRAVRGATDAWFQRKHQRPREGGMVGKQCGAVSGTSGEGGGG